jgi:hypothetical protein
VIRRDLADGRALGGWGSRASGLVHPGIARSRTPARPAVSFLIWNVVGIAASEAELDKLGDSLVRVEAGSRNAAGVRTGGHGTSTLTARDADAIRREVALVKDVSENVDGGFQVVARDHNGQSCGQSTGAASRFAVISAPCPPLLRR